MRAGVVGKKNKKRASTERENLRLDPNAKPGEGPEEGRAYSRDVINKAFQVRAEKRARKKGRDPNVARNSGHIAGLDVPAPTLGKQPRGRMMRRVDADVYAGEQVRRNAIKRAKQETNAIAPLPKRSRFPGSEGRKVRDIVKDRVVPARRAARVRRDESPLVKLIAEGTVISRKNVRGELRARLRQLESKSDAAAKHSPGVARGNKASIAEIKALLKLDDAAMDRVWAAAQAFRDAEGSRQARLRETGQYDAAEQSTRWFPYLQSHHRLQGEQLREAALKLEEGADRVKVGNKTIRRPADEPAFVTQRPVRTNDKGEAPEAYQPPISGSGLTGPPGGKRSGTAYELGAIEGGAEALVRQAITSEGRAKAAEIGQHIAKEYGAPAGKDGRGYADSFHEAEARAKEIAEDPLTGELKPGHTRLVPFNINGFKAYGDKLRQIQANIGLDPKEAARLEEDALAEALTGAVASGGKGKWVLMPADVVRRLQQHADVRRHDAAGFTNLFKDVVLTTSSPTTWLTGNISDLGFRTIMEGITLPDVIRGRAIVRDLESQGLEGEMAAALIARGGLFHSSSMTERFSPARIEETWKRTYAAAPWRAWKGAVYGIEHYIEALPQYGAVGKAARRGVVGKAPRAQRALNDRTMKQNLAALLRATDEQVDYYAGRIAADKATTVRIQHLTEDVMGRWGKVSPSMRKALVAAPFVQWLGAALRYTLVTLPTKHPIKTGIFAAIMDMTAEERARLGLSYMIPQDQRVQDYQMGTLPMRVEQGKYGLKVSGIRTGNLTSFGTAGHFPQNIPNFMLPQLRGIFGALTGQGFTGEDMVYPEWYPDKDLRGLPLSPEDRLMVAIGAIIEVGVPFTSMFRRAVLEKGQSSLPQSTILSPAVRKVYDQQSQTYKENEATVWGGISEWLNPLAMNRVLTHDSVRDIREGAEAGRVYGRAAEKKQREVANAARSAGQDPRDAVKLYKRLGDVRKKKKAIAEANPGVDSDNPTPEYRRLHLSERRLNERLARLTDGKEGHRYKSPYRPTGGGESGYPSYGGSDAGGDEYAPYGGSDSGSSGGDYPSYSGG